MSEIHVEMDDLRRYIVRQPEVEQYAAARTARMAARKSSRGDNQTPRSVEMADPCSSSSSGGEMEVDMASPSSRSESNTDDVPMVPIVLPAVPVIPESAPTPRFPSALLALPLGGSDSEVEAEGWQGAVPSQWVPIISRDSVTQQQTGENGPFSDAYNSGQPPKRRRLNDEQKPHGGTRDLITDSLKVC